MRLGDREWHERFDRDRDSFDRAWRWLIPVAVVLSIVSAVAFIVLALAGATWIWSLAP